MKTKYPSIFGLLAVLLLVMAFTVPVNGQTPVAINEVNTASSVTAAPAVELPLSAITQGGPADWRYIIAVTDNVSNSLNTAIVTDTISNYAVTVAAYADTMPTFQSSSIYSAHDTLMPDYGMLLANNFCFCGGTFQIGAILLVNRHTSTYLQDAPGA